MAQEKIDFHYKQAHIIHQGAQNQTIFNQLDKYKLIFKNTKYFNFKSKKSQILPQMGPISRFLAQKQLIWGKLRLFYTI